MFGKIAPRIVVDLVFAVSVAGDQPTMSAGVRQSSTSRGRRLSEVPISGSADSGVRPPILGSGVDFLKQHSDVQRFLQGYRSIV